MDRSTEAWFSLRLHLLSGKFSVHQIFAGKKLLLTTYSWIKLDICFPTKRKKNFGAEYKFLINEKMTKIKCAVHTNRKNLPTNLTQMLASMKRQFVELLSDIGFTKEGLTVRVLERLTRDGGDGVIGASGHEVRLLTLELHIPPHKIKLREEIL